jgi:hypothetical protein
VLGLVAGYIAWRQWRTAHDRLILDLFERRFQVFQELTRTVSEAVSKPHPAINDLANFDQAFEKARFLFGPEVYGYLREVRGHLVNLITSGGALHSMPDGAKRTSTENEVSAGLNEMNSFHARFADLVTPYYGCLCVKREGHTRYPWPVSRCPRHERTQRRRSPASRA